MNNIINELDKIKYLFEYRRNNVLYEQNILNESNDRPVGCRKYRPTSGEFKLCKELSNKEYRGLIFPVISKILEVQKRKWIEVMSETDIDQTFNILRRLRDDHPNKKWYWASSDWSSRTESGTIDDFIEKRLPELSFVYDLDNGNKWSQINKLDTNYSDNAVFITDVINDSKSLNAETIYNDLLNKDTTSLKHAVNLISSYPELIYNRYLKDPVKYTESSVYNSKQGDEIENSVIILMLDNGYELVHKGSGGDPIDVLLGIDVIMEKDGELVTVQCKKVWSITYENETLLNPKTGAYKISGTPYVSKQKNLDLVAYGDKTGSIIVAKKQREVIKSNGGFEYGEKYVLPTPLGSSSVFYVDYDSVVLKKI